MNRLCRLATFILATSAATTHAGDTKAGNFADVTALERVAFVMQGGRVVAP